MTKKFRVFLLFFTLLSVTNSYAQYQFPDPGFEDWSGAQFANSIQPKDWRFSNVSQLGVDKNFAHRATGRSGYCLLIQDQFVGVGSIGATSPGYVALGQPWAYVSSLTSINDATAGTYGGINWTHRPDSITLWIKRVYDSSVDQAAGDHIADENFNIVYYAWTGTSQGGQYKAKNGSCTDISRSKPAYCVDEESDIRQALDNNECGTQVPAVQIAEAWYREKARYDNWTKITIPIYYLSDNAPQKCNLILSAGNYPNFRANTGLYAGNSLYVDDVELIYSSKIQKLYINNREWKGFDPENTTTEQVYSLGQGATLIPDIYAVRGAGALTNTKGTTAAFTGRRLNDQECVIQNGTVDGAPTVITVRSEDGSSTSTYRIRFVSQASNNARLADIRVNGQTINGFNAYLNTYNVALPYGTTAVPQVAADAQDAGASVQITQPTSTNGTATITVTAQDGSTVQTYTLQFSVALLSDVTLRDILVDGASVPGFSPSKANYTISLPLGTTVAPQVVPVSAYPAGEQTITILRNNLTEGCHIQVSAPGAVASKTYKLTYRIEASQYSLLQSLMIDGEQVQNFDPEEFVYYLNLPLGTTQLPAISWTQGDRYQTVTSDLSGIQNMEGTATVTVTAASGAQSVYRIVISVEKSEINSLEAIYLDGELLDGFDPNTTSYRIELPIGTATVPAITWQPGDEYQTVSMTAGGIGATTRIFVTAQNGATRIYQLAFSVATSSDATLRMIYLDGEELEGFTPSRTDYDVALPQGTSELPTVTYLQHDDYQTISTRPATSLNGDYKIIVKPQTGAAQTYTLHFSVATSANCSLADLTLNGQTIEGFHPDTLHYTDTLPLGVSILPTVGFSKQENVQKVQMQTVGNVVNVTVTAENGSKRTYSILFVVQKSENAFLGMIYLAGDSLKNFDPEVLNYTVVLPDSVQNAPLITVDKNAGQKVLIAQPSRLGTATLTVSPEQGAPNIYRILFVSESDSSQIITPDEPETDSLSTDGQLQAIMLDGELVSGFLPGVYSYEHIIRQSGEQLPVVSYVKGNERQVVAYGQTAADRISLFVMAEAGNVVAYTLSFDYAASADCNLLGIALDGEALEGFRPDVYEYRVELPQGDVQLPRPAISLPEKAMAVVSATPDKQVIDVTAEDTTIHRQYTVYYTIRPYTSARLTAITLDEQPLAGFDPDSLLYVVDLPWHASSLPEINATSEEPVSRLTVRYGNLNEATEIIVAAQDSTIQRTYSIVFRSSLSSDASLADIQVDGAECNFDPAQTEYLVALPYGTIETPELLVEKAMDEQQVVISRRSLKEETTVEVLAEDGITSRTYTFRFAVEQSTADNVLTAIVVDGVGALDLSQGPDFTVSLPYGSSTMNIVNIAKSFPEQTVVVEQGGVSRPTVITVSSNREGEADMVYTITPDVKAYDPACLIAITVDGEPLAGFDPQVFSYVINVGDELPAIGYTAQEGADVYDNTSNSKLYSIDVEAGNYLHTYTVYFYYPQDLTFDTDFEEWIDHTNSGTNKSGSYPRGWHTPLTAVTTGDKGTYYPQNTTIPTDEVSSGDHAASLNTIYLLTSAEAMPGFLSLSEPSVKVGTYYVISHSASTLSYGDPIQFRNTPDRVMLDYNFKSAQKITGWRFNYTVNGNRKIDVNEQYSTLTANVWRTLDQPLTYDADFVPSSLDILISSAHTDALNTYYIGANGASSRNHYLSTLLVDNLRLIYNSALASVRVNGMEAQIDGTEITTSVDAESWGVPMLDFTGEVSDQGRLITWQPEVDGIRRATVRNIAEDGSYTEYQLTVTRPLSAIDTCSYLFDGRDLTITPGSAHQQLNVVKNDTAYIINVTSETGSTRTYTLPFAGEQAVVRDTLPAVPFRPQINQEVVELAPEHEVSDNSQLETIMVGAEPMTGFSPLVTEYTVASADRLILAPVRSELAQTTYVSRDADVVSIRVVAEDGEHETVYTVRLQNQLSGDADLTGILLNGETIESFAKDSYVYNIVLQSADPKTRQPQIPDIAFLAADSLQQVVVEMAPLGQTTYLTVTAADGNQQSQYELTFTSTLSACTTLAGIRVNGTSVEGYDKDQHSYELQLATASAQVTYTKGDAFQTVNVERTGFVNNTDVVTLTVTAENGETAQYVLTLVAPEPSQDATLEAIYLDGTLLPGFSASETDYSVTLPKGSQLPDVSAVLSDDHANAVIITEGDTAHITVTAEDGISQMTYTVAFDIERSSDAHLQMIYLDEEDLPAFAEDVFTYEVEVAVGKERPAVSWQKKEDAQRVESSVSGDNSILLVTAEDGTQLTYQLHFTFLLSEVDTLAAIYEDGMDLDGFIGSRMQYEINLPVGTASFPQLSYEPGDQWQTVAVDTVLSDEWHQTIRMIATAQAGNSRIYTVAYTILKSEVDTLQMIWLNNQPLEGFSGSLNDYTLTLPYGTTELPDVDYIPGDQWQRVDTAWSGQTVRIHAVAQSGAERTYTLSFTIARSNNALLKTIDVDGSQITGFYDRLFQYSISLPYGTTVLPAVRWTEGDEQQVTDSVWNDLKLTINVTAGDGTTTSAYEVQFVILPSTNASLEMLYLDGQPIAGFLSDDYQYTDTLPYGTEHFPTVTWTAGDEQQTVTVAEQGNDIIVTVTAGDGATTEEYTITFVLLLSPNNYLAALKAKGTTVEGFHRDSALYHIVYPVGTLESELLTGAEIEATPEEPEATVVVSEEADHSITIMVTAPNGDVRVYVITQEILLSDEARLKMIWLDGEELRDFDPDVTDYTLILAPGTNMPEVTAETLDALAEVEYGSFEDITGEDYEGKFIEIDGVAENGDRITYRVTFRYANWSATADVDTTDYVFVHIPGTRQYKAVSISIGLKVAVYDMTGSLLLLEEVPVADPADVTVEITADGDQRLVDINPDANGVVFEVPVMRTPYFYVFFDTKQKRVAKGGKFMLTD